MTETNVLPWIEVNEMMDDEYRQLVVADQLQEVLLNIKQKTDEKVLLMTSLLNNDGYFSSMVMQLLVGAFDKIKVPLEPDSVKFINNLLVPEYINEYQGL